ncbi:hypothetical protein [Rothia nasimurium]|uniref:hypothetical protein n=1 Tax=Rothia nasimurium TaxID=85336 RepID=UPI001F161BD2|nr:hypothetical protein [Rothia nasimurium]
MNYATSDVKHSAGGFVQAAGVGGVMNAVTPYGSKGLNALGNNRAFRAVSSDKVREFTSERLADAINGASTYALTPQPEQHSWDQALIKGLENSAKGAANSHPKVSQLKAVEGPSIIGASSLSPGVQLGAGEVGLVGVDTAVAHVEGSNEDK